MEHYFLFIVRFNGVIRYFIVKDKTEEGALGVVEERLNSKADGGKFWIIFTFKMDTLPTIIDQE